MPKKIAQRSTDQNRLMWQRLTDWAEQDPRYTLAGRRLDALDMKEVLMASFTKEVELTPDLENKRIIHISRSTSRLTKDQFNQFLEHIAAEGTKRGIIFRDTPPGPISEPVVRSRPDRLPMVPRNEHELRNALQASVRLLDEAKP